MRQRADEARAQRIADAEEELDEDEGDEGDEGEEEEDEDEFDEFEPDAPPLDAAYAASELNDPRLTAQGEAPLLSGRQRILMNGVPTETVGRPTSPPMWVEGANLPGAERFRVYKNYNGSQTSVGEIDVNCVETEFIRYFYAVMPKPDEPPVKFILKPVNGMGIEFGGATTRNIDSNHVFLAHLREQEKNRMSQQHGGGVHLVNTGDQGAGITAATEEMGRMFELQLEQQAEQTAHYREALESERERIRLQEQKNAEERIRLAESQGSAVEKMSERLLASDRQRADELLRAQKEQSQFMLNMLSGTATTSTEMIRADAERRRLEDERKIEAERNQRRLDAEAAAERIRQERADAEAKRAAERAENEERRARERAEAEERRQHEREEAKRELEARKADLEARLAAEEKRLEARRLELAEETKRREIEEERRRTREREDWERKMQVEKDERERAARAEAERIAREREDLHAREERRREEARADEARRQELLQFQIKQLDAQAQTQIKQLETQAAMAKAESEARERRDREHAERMLALAAQERADARDAAERRERMEREARESQEKERERKHALELSRMEQQAREAREHQERLIALQKDQSSGGFGKIGELVGMEPTEVLKRIFGGKGDGEEGEAGAPGWMAAIPDLLGAAATAYQRMQQQRAKENERKPNEAVQMVTINTPQGPRTISIHEYRQIQDRNAQLRSQMQPGALPAPAPNQQPMPTQLVPQGPARPAPPRVVAPPTLPTEDVQLSQDATTPTPVPTPAPAPTPVPAEPEAVGAPEASFTPPQAFLDAEKVNCLQRAKDAGIPLKDSRSAKKLIREMLKKASTSPEEDWAPLAMGVIVSRPEVVKYLTAVTVWAGLVEAKADPELTCRVVEAIRAGEAAFRADMGNASAPPMVPFTEADLAALATPAPVIVTEAPEAPQGEA